MINKKFSSNEPYNTIITETHNGIRTYKYKYFKPLYVVCGSKLSQFLEIPHTTYVTSHVSLDYKALEDKINGVKKILSGK